MIALVLAALVLHGGHSGPAGTSCGVTPHWQYFHRGGTLRYSGSVPGAAAGTSVKIVIERCYARGFSVVESFTLKTAAGGAFAGSTVVNARSDCFVQASSGRWRSNRAYFRVR
jgi:hypothetical protein